MDRRPLVNIATATTPAGSVAFGAGRSDGSRADGGRAGAQSHQADGAGQSERPNILVIKVDQLRFPTVFPPGISSPGAFLQQVMPNLHQLWQSGVKFVSHYTAACACTPARGTILTGLYAQQSWLVQTILAKPYTPISVQPWLNPQFPTYGSLLRSAGYQTPYAGKWHVSIPGQAPSRLDHYGFAGLSYYDPTGANLQGAYGDEANGYQNDQDIAEQGAQWLAQHGAGAAPWCLTVSLINPHDKEFFWAGTEFQTYNALFQPDGQYKPFTYYSVSPYGPEFDKKPLVPWEKNALKDPPPLGYPAVPPNWETAAQIAANKPSTQTYSRLFQELVWGGVTDDASQQDFDVGPYPPAPYPSLPGTAYGIGLAPFGYWKRNLDSYTQIMSVADGAIGRVMQAFSQLPAATRNNTVIVFTSDHGEYAGAHGFLSGKVGSLYDEAFHVPLIVVDPSGRFTADIEVPREGLTSSVDVLPLLVGLGHGGGRDWLSGDLGRIYGERHDLLAMLRSAQAPGRRYVLFTSDEGVPAYFNFNHAPTHLVGMRTADHKFGLYANWHNGTARIADDRTLETEFYDYATPQGRAELDNLKGDPRIPELKRTLLDDIIPNVLHASLPGALGAAQEASKKAYLAYDAVMRNVRPRGHGDEAFQEYIAFGVDF